MVGMTKPSGGKTRLAAAIKDRRRELGLRQDELRAAGGPSPQTVLDYENAKIPDEPQPRTLTGFDRALRWREGTSQRILTGRADYPDNIAQPRPTRRLARELRRTMAPEAVEWVPVPGGQVKDLAMQASKLAVWSRMNPLGPEAQELVEGIHAIAAEMLALAIGVEMGDTELVELIGRLSDVTGATSATDKVSVADHNT